MKDDKLRKSAEQITMPDELKNRILDKCAGIAADEKKNDIRSDHVSGVERVAPRPIKRTLTAAAACAVLAAGVGAGVHFMPKSGGSESASELSEMFEPEESSLPAGFEDIFGREFRCESSKELTEEQRNEIKDIISGYEWTEISKEQFDSSGDHTEIYYFEADHDNDLCSLVLYGGDRAMLVYSAGTEDDVITYYRVRSQEIADSVMKLFTGANETDILPDDAAVLPLAGIAEREYREIGYSAKEAIPEEKRIALDKLVSETEFELDPYCEMVSGVPAYIFTDKSADKLDSNSPITYIYASGYAEVHEYGKKWFYQFNFDKFSRGVDEILFPDSVFTGKDLVCANMVSEDVYFNGMKNFEHYTLSDESRQAIFDFLSNARFRKVECDANSSVEGYFNLPDKGWSNHELGYISYTIASEDASWSIQFCDCGKVIVVDTTSGSPETSCYIFCDDVGIDHAITEAIPELSASYPPFGTFYKMGDISVNGTVLNDNAKRYLSTVFFGYNYSNEEISESFREDAPAYQIETDINDEKLTVRTYQDGTVEYQLGSGDVHTFDKLGSPETWASASVALINTELDLIFDIT